MARVAAKVKQYCHQTTNGPVSEPPTEIRSHCCAVLRKKLSARATTRCLALAAVTTIVDDGHVRGKVLLKAVQRGLLSARVRRYESAEGPGGVPQAHSSGVNPDRILVFGTGPAIGHGVQSHKLALPGQLAAAITAVTGRGADVDLVASPDISIENAIENLGARELDRYDVIVVFLGVSDALTLLPVGTYRVNLDDFVLFALTESPVATRITFVAVEPLRSFVSWDARIRPDVDKHARLLNEATRDAVAGNPRLSYLSLPASRGQVERQRSDREYREWAEAIAIELAPTLDAAAGIDPSSIVGNASSASRPRLGQDDEKRLAAVEALGILDSPADARIDRIVEAARERFGTTSAAFTLIDRDRQWYKSAAGTDDTGSTLGDSICTTTVQQAGAFIVPDTDLDPRFDHLTKLRFYAGFPIESPDGQRIGALCVFDPAPHAASTVDQAELRDLALEIQHELWRYLPAG